MKYFLIICTFIFSLNAFADREIGFDIATMKKQSAKPSNPKAGHKKIYFKDDVLTTLDTTGLEDAVGKKDDHGLNLSFESGTNGWTCSSNTDGVTSENINVVDGKKSLKVSLGGDIRGCLQNITLPDGLVGKDLEFSVWIRSTEAAELCYVNDVETKCVDYSTELELSKLILVAKPVATTNNTIIFRSKTTNVGALFADLAYVGLPKSDEAIVAKFDNISPSVSYTPTPTGLTIGNGSISGRYSRHQNKLIGNIKFKSGTTSTFTNSTWTFSLPSGLTIDTKYYSDTLAGVPFSAGEAVGQFNNGTTGNARTGIVVINSSNALAVKIAPDKSGYSNLYWDSTSTGVANNFSSTDFTLSFEVPIAEWSSQTNAAIIACKEGPLKCANEYTFTRSSTGTIDNVLPAGWITCGALSAGASTCTINSGVGLTVPMSCISGLSTTSAAQGDSAITQVYSISTSGLSVSTYTQAGASSARRVTVNCTKQAPDYNAGYEKVLGFTEDADIRSTEWLTGGFDYIDNKPIYRRCHKVVTTLTANQAITTWPTNLNPKGIMGWLAGSYVIQSAYVNTGLGTLVFYQKSSGSVYFEKSGAGVLDAGTTLCMDYVK